MAHNGGMSRAAPVLCSAIDLPTGGVPEWVHVLPTTARTVDGRGPYRIDDAAALMSASLPVGGKLVLDECHATDLATPTGGAAPARGWIVALQSRDDGIWGRVEWTGTGRQMIEDRQYRGVSPVITHRKDGTVTGILRASLTNTPNLTGMVSLHHQTENDMDLRQALAELLKLGGDADDAAILAAIRTKMGDGGDAAAVALQSALKPIALAAGLAEDADAAAVLAGVQQLAGGDDNVTALQSEIVGLTGKIAALETEGKRTAATAFVDAAIAAGRVGVRAARDEYIALQMAEPARAGKLIAAMPIVAPGKIVKGDAPEGQEQNPALLASRGSAYQKKLAAEGQEISFAAAVRAVSEGKDK
ncbi:phage protease [Sphingomonas panni]|uniref:phage protease n=1 Tax=Sphingomonas panni TaxID=237612 RepID=UPI001F5B14CB|nr:phage protease [Sphingomonas panni]